mgnify:CR=1 FL=1
MRQIKFRVPIFDNSGKFLYFSYWGFLERGFAGLTSTNFGDNGITTAQERSQQFTGLLDENGKEIYEGDIMEIRFIDGNTRIGSVEWGKTHTHFYINVVKSTDGHTGSHSIGFSGSAVDGKFVIGNIYENPELLEAL